jgi:hypothetical protein
MRAAQSFAIAGGTAFWGGAAVWELAIFAKLNIIATDNATLKHILSTIFPNPLPATRLRSSTSNCKRPRLPRGKAMVHLGERVSALGQTRKSPRLNGMSVLPPTADVVGSSRHVRVVPKTDFAVPSLTMAQATHICSPEFTLWMD